jgi:hypothetical protein
VKHNPAEETVGTALMILHSLLETGFVEVWFVAVVADVTVEDDEKERCYWK